MADRSQRFLVIYSGVLTAVFAITVLSGFATPRAKKKRIVLQVQADGTPSLSFLDANGKVVNQWKAE